MPYLRGMRWFFLSGRKRDVRGPAPWAVSVRCYTKEVNPPCGRAVMLRRWPRGGGRHPFGTLVGGRRRVYGQGGEERSHCRHECLLLCPHLLPCTAYASTSGVGVSCCGWGGVRKMVVDREGVTRSHRIRIVLVPRDPPLPSTLLGPRFRLDIWTGVGVTGHCSSTLLLALLPTRMSV